MHPRWDRALQVPSRWAKPDDEHRATREGSKVTARGRYSAGWRSWSIRGTVDLTRQKFRGK